MTQPVEILDAPIGAAEVAAELEALSRRYRAAGGLVITLLNQIGGQAETLLERLPEAVKDGLEAQTLRALRGALELAGRSREAVADEPVWMTRTLTTAMGAAGGLGGLPSALAELPVTTTLLLRAIQSIARTYGFDPAEERVKFDCLCVFAVAGPLAKENGAEIAFFSTRLMVNGAALNTLISRVAPRLSLVLGQKLGAQTLPVLGAAAGAATNYAYTRYYQDMAHVHFGLRRLALRADLQEDALLSRFQDVLAQSD